MFACDAVDLDFLNTAPKRLDAAITPVLPRAFPLVMIRVGHNLERGRWFSTPTTNP